MVSGSGWECYVEDDVDDKVCDLLRSFSFSFDLDGELDRYLAGCVNVVDGRLLGEHV